MPNETPDPLDRVIAQSRPQQGDMPAELANPGNYLVFDRLTGDGELDAAGVLTASQERRLSVSDPDTTLGVVVGAVEPVTPEDIASELDTARAADDSVGQDSSAYLPDWAAVSATPSLAPAAEPRRLVRRNGTRVRPEWVLPPTDSRSPYFPNTWPFSLVGRIFVWQNAASPNWSWWGTASLLGARTILTASHVVPWGSGNWKALFIPGYYDGASVHGAWAASWVTNAQGYNPHGQGDDMAVMRLDVALGSSLGFFGFRTYDPRWQNLNVWTLPGYPWDKDSGNRPWLHMNFAITDDDNDGAGVELEYQADTEGGQSGAPVYAWFSGSPDVVGTHSGGEDNFGETRQNLAAGGNALTNLLHWGRNNWP